MSDQNRVPLRYITIPEGLWLANRAFLPSMTHLNVENSYIWALFMANLPIAGHYGRRQRIHADHFGDGLYFTRQGL